jgi:SAM-dependent methyltransferase
MKLIRGDLALLGRLNSDDRLQVANFGEFEARFDELNEAFHAHFSPMVAHTGVENCKYHKGRYIAILKERLEGTILDIGNDKPFLSFWLKKFHPTANIEILSFDVPETPFDLFAVDIESESIPLDAGSVDKILFAEVLEHLWRDPAHAVHQMNETLKMGGTIYVTTPNACELHAITCILWQANPNQRNAFYSRLEAGHLHLWTARELGILFETNGFEIQDLLSFDPYGYTERTGKLVELIRNITPHFDLMGESLIMRARKITSSPQPVYDPRLFPTGKGVQFEGTLKSFARMQKA